MSKRIVFNPLFNHIQGKYNLKDEDGCPTPFTLREMSASGKVSLQVGESRQRNLDEKPYSQIELVHQSKFRQASAQTKLVMADAEQKALYQAEFSEARKAGLTKQNTLRGYIFAKLYESAEYVPGSGDTNTQEPTPNTPTGGSTKVTVTLSASPSIGGSVTGGGEYDKGSSVELKAEAKPGYSFSKWSDNDTNATRTVTVTSDLNLTAIFTADNSNPEDEENIR